MSSDAGSTVDLRTSARSRPPGWLILATGALAAIVLTLAVSETNLRAHYLIDEGEFISLFGLAFILVAGLALYRRGRLFVSLPLVFPWLLYPLITQGDQIIDNLSINPMRIISHVLLGLIFGTPVAVAVLGARFALTPRPGRQTGSRRWTALFPGLGLIAAGRTREGTTLLAVALLTAEMWLANQYLGTLMIVTLIVMIFAVLLYGSSTTPADPAATGRRGTERFALVVLLAGVAVSLGAYVGYKNAPGSYQGSPSVFMNPAQQDAQYPVDRIAVPDRPAALPGSAAAVREALTGYAAAFERLLAGYHILDRNYTYDFHNELFMRRTPLLANYRATGLKLVAESATLRADADARCATARATLTDDDPLAALLDDVRAYAAFAFERSPLLERMSAGFERTPAGLQHAAHLYEGECHYLGETLAQIVTKHRTVVAAPAVAPVTGQFAAACQSMFEAYAHRVVGF